MVRTRTGEFPQNLSSWIGITTPIASRSCELYGLQGASQAFEGKAYELLEVMSFVRGIYSPVSSCIMSGGLIYVVHRDDFIDLSSRAGKARVCKQSEEEEDLIVKDRYRWTQSSRT